MSKPRKPNVILLKMLKRAVIVDGDPAMLSMVANYLSHAEVETIVKFSDGNEAIQSIQETPPDILILDWKLKNPSGPDVYQRIRSQPELVKIPILLISGSVTAADVKVAKADSNAKFIVKPFVEEILLSFLTKFVGAIASSAESTATTSASGLPGNQVNVQDKNDSRSAKDEALNSNSSNKTTLLSQETR